MARGWESKDVESRIQDAQERTAPKGQAASPEQRAKDARRHLLELQQSRLLTEMREAKTDRMLDLLRRELAWVQSHIKELE